MAASATGRVSLPPNYITDVPAWQRLVTVWIHQANQGHINNVGTFSALSGTASTVLTDARIGNFSYIGFTPTTANAAAELGNGTLFVATQSKGAATITHANGATGDRTFRYAILG